MGYLVYELYRTDENASTTFTVNFSGLPVKHVGLCTKGWICPNHQGSQQVETFPGIQFSAHSIVDGLPH